MINVTPVNYDNAIELASLKINALIVGEKRYALRMPANFNLKEIKALKNQVSCKIYVVVNGLFMDEDLDELTIYLKDLKALNIDSVIFADMAVYQINKKHNIGLQLIYSTETTITNYYFSEYYHNLGVGQIDLAREITLSEITEIAKRKKNKISINLHGHIYMYHSMRPLLDNFAKTAGQNIDERKDNLYLYDSERRAYYPIVEDAQGTHILSSYDLCSIKHLDKIIDANIDEYKIDGFGYTKEQIFKITKLYLEAFELVKKNREQYKQNKNTFFEQMSEINPHKTFGTGFLFKKTTY